jgi:2-polyprenyl-6-methoxyphenol hydroxylase-like FAD-dependent oxidoreductase
MDIDVLIVGAGPTGLMLANQLGRRGIRVMIIDRHSGPAQQTRAMAVHARTLEIYAKLGIAERALALGRRGNGANMWATGKRMARIPLGDIGKTVSPFPFVLMLGQDDNERILGERLNQQNISIQWNTELIALAQMADGVYATLKLPDGSHSKICAAYVAGCDGAHSAVREFCEIKFPGAPYEHVFFVADTEATGNMVPDELNVYLWRDGFHLFFPMAGNNRWRVIGILPKRLRNKDDVTFDELSPDIQREAGANLYFKACSWFSTYRIAHRAAEKFRDKRCFLLGDAAHIHSPMGGQGMNTGLQDAYNLAWKLALLVKGQANESLLDSYDAERLPVAQRLLKTTDRAFTMLVSDHWLAGIFRTRILANIAAFAMTFEWTKRLAFQTISQIGIHYRHSPLSQTLANQPPNAPKAGDRFPWLQLKFQTNGPVEDIFQKMDDTRYILIVIGQHAPEEMSGLDDLIITHVIPDDAHNIQELASVGISGLAFYLVRPDGHIGLTGDSITISMLEAHLSNIGIRLQ